MAAIPQALERLEIMMLSTANWEREPAEGIYSKGRLTYDIVSENRAYFYWEYGWFNWAGAVAT